jgi:hypothetical protein
VSSSLVKPHVKLMQLTYGRLMKGKGYNVVPVCFKVGNEA